MQGLSDYQIITDVKLDFRSCVLGVQRYPFTPETGVHKQGGTICKLAKHTSCGGSHQLVFG